MPLFEITSQDTEGGTISQSIPWSTKTGHLDRHTVLHKRYAILRTVGQGGMGAVYQAKDLKRQVTCAIKEMSLSMVPADERLQAIEKFKDEAKMLWGLNHPNLPTITGFFSENQRYFIVMEFIDGTTLQELLENNDQPFPQWRILNWARQLCDVLEYLHSQNPPIIFRDMKPGNIMLTRTGQIKLIDFGIARFFRPMNPLDTQQLGTPGFAPPEQYGKAQTDERSDIYSLAVTLFQLLTHSQGFAIKDLRALNPHVSTTVARALEKAASLQPENRYQRVADFRRALLNKIFSFESGDQATTPKELADLCARYPDEAFDYLCDGEIESWLGEIGDGDIARAVRGIRTSVNDPVQAVEHLIQTLMGPKAGLRSDSMTQSALKVEVDFLGSTPVRVSHGGKTQGANLDEDDKDMLAQDTTPLSPNAPAVKTTTKVSMIQTQIGLPDSATTRNSKYTAKYGQLVMNSNASSGWDPLRATPGQRLWMQRGLALVAAFMLASLCYTIMAQLPFLAHIPPLMPSPWFTFVLTSMVPAATLGALIVHRNKNWTSDQTLDRFCVGMGGVLLTIAVGNLGWQLLFPATLAPLQFVLLLVMASLSATIGVVSNYIIDSILWMLRRMRSLFMTFILLLGGTLGFLLTPAAPFSWFTLSGILVGVAVAIALVLRMPHLTQQNHVPQPPLV